MVGYTHIDAPFDGVITARYVDPGALIQAEPATCGSTGTSGGSAPVVRIADIDTLRVYVYVPEEETSLIKRGMTATLTLREFPGRSSAGSVARFNTALDLSTRTMLTEVDLANADHELYPGHVRRRHARARAPSRCADGARTAVGAGWRSSSCTSCVMAISRRQHGDDRNQRRRTVEVVSGLQGRGGGGQQLEPGPHRGRQGTSGRRRDEPRPSQDVG